ncbi:MAG: hypothetical protein R3F60_32345 [bacterium]
MKTLDRLAEQQRRRRAGEDVLRWVQRQELRRPRSHDVRQPLQRVLQRRIWMQWFCSSRRALVLSSKLLIRLEISRSVHRGRRSLWGQGRGADEQVQVAGEEVKGVDVDEREEALARPSTPRGSRRTSWDEGEAVVDDLLVVS